MGMRIKKTMCYFAENMDYDSKSLNEFLEEFTIQKLYDISKKDNYFDGKDYLSDIGNAVYIYNKFKDDSIYNIHNYILNDEEFLGEKMIGFLPFACSDWSRYDDNIDYQEFYMDYPDHEVNHTIKYLNRSIWPYEGYMNKNTGQRVNERNNLISLDKYVEDANRDKFHESVKKQTGFDNVVDLEQNTVPYVPEDIKMIMHYSGAFKNVQESYLKLRPAIVQYWS